MRLWSLHPRYLDPAGLVALWREALLAQRVLAGGTRGYRHHPQLDRFRAAPDPAASIAAYLAAVAGEAAVRSYRFDRSLIGAEPQAERLSITSGQLELELEHLRAKLALRCPAWISRLPAAGTPMAHPLFQVVAGPVAPWERQGRS